MIKFEISSLQGRSEVRGLWVTLENRNAVMVLEGKREYLETEEVKTLAQAKAEKYWHRQEVEGKMLNEISAKYPKKSVVIDGNEIQVWSKNGSLFKTFKVEY
ncbi:MAG TPA: hypothetical protein DEP72_06370 [Clostridiales bacterium]|nr:hypothetical protein [Clostridiales bacterium]